MCFFFVRFRLSIHSVFYIYIAIDREEKAFKIAIVVDTRCKLVKTVCNIFCAFLNCFVSIGVSLHAVK